MVSLFLLDIKHGILNLNFPRISLSVRLLGVDVLFLGRLGMLSSNLGLERRIEIFVNDREGSPARTGGDRAPGALDVFDDAGGLGLGFSLSGGGLKGLGEVHINIEGSVTAGASDLERLFGCRGEGIIGILFDLIKLLTIVTTPLEREEGKEDAEDGKDRKETLADNGHAAGVVTGLTGPIDGGTDDSTATTDTAIGRTLVEGAVKTDVGRLGVLGANNLVLHEV